MPAGSGDQPERDAQTDHQRHQRRIQPRLCGHDPGADHRWHGGLDDADVAHHARLGIQQPKQPDHERRADHQLVAQAQIQRLRMLTQRIEAQLHAHRQQRQRRQGVAHARQYCVHDRRKGHRGEQQRHQQRDEGRKAGHLAQHRGGARARFVAIQRGCQRTDRAQRQVRAQLVDQQAQTQPVAAMQRLDHRQPDERGIAETANQRQRTDAGARQPQHPANAPEQQCTNAEQQPRHHHRCQRFGADVNTMQMAQCQRGQREVDDDHVDHPVAAFGNAAAVAQQHAGDQASH